MLCVQVCVHVGMCAGTETSRSVATIVKPCCLVASTEEQAELCSNTTEVICAYFLCSHTGPIPLKR
jgi:hypothetical protein